MGVKISITIGIFLLFSILILPSVSALDIGMYYIWHYSDDYESDWASYAGNIYDAFNYLQSYNWGISWTATGLEEVRTDYPIGHGQNLPSYFTIEDIIKDVAQKSEWLKIDYESYDMIVFIFANTRDAYVVDYSSPMYASDSAFKYPEHRILLAHEILHTFGCGDGWGGDKCIMSYLGDDAIICSQCMDRFELHNYKKRPYSDVVPNGGNGNGNGDCNGVGWLASTCINNEIWSCEGLATNPQLKFVKSCGLETCKTDGHSAWCESKAVCGNGMCESGESPITCPSDCRPPPNVSFLSILWFFKNFWWLIVIIFVIALVLLYRKGKLKGLEKKLS